LRVAVSPVALEAIGVSKTFGTRDALCRVDLIAQRGEVHGLLGPNGAGKTTLMRILLGLVRRDAGTVQLLGCGIDAVPDALPGGVAGLVEVPAFYPYLSGRANLALLARLDGVSRSSGRRGVDSALEQVGLAAQADTAVAGYSAGMRQRLGLAAALLRSPQLLFLDEPTSALDPSGARDVRALARRLADEGAAVVLSSHDMAEVEELCTAVTILDSGRVVFSGTTDDLRQRAPAAVHALRTSDDGAARAIASRWPCVTVASGRDGALEISTDVETLDGYIIALGRAGVAVRALERRTRSIESLFLELTTRGDRREARVPASRQGEGAAEDLEAAS
jgi:ABC-2 type transport system ATP-binding protein